MKWFIFILYWPTAIAAALRWRSSSVEREEVVCRRFWVVLAGGLILFGFNKVADLQTAFLLTLKRVAVTLELTAFHSVLKALLLAAVLLVAVVGGTALLQRFYSSLRRH